MEQIQRIVAVVDEVHSPFIRRDRQTEQRARSLLRHINRFDRHLPAARCRFDHIAIARVCSEDMTVRGNRKPEWSIERAALRDSYSRTRIVNPEKGVLNNSDPVLESIRDIQPAIEGETKTSRPDHQRCRIGAFPETAGDDRSGHFVWNSPVRRR